MSINQKDLKSNLITMLNRSKKNGDNDLTRKELGATLGWLGENNRNSALYQFATQYSSIPKAKAALVKKFPKIFKMYFDKYKTGGSGEKQTVTNAGMGTGTGAAGVIESTVTKFSNMTGAILVIGAIGVIWVLFNYFQK